MSVLFKTGDVYEDVDLFYGCKTITDAIEVQKRLPTNIKDSFDHFLSWTRCNGCGDAQENCFIDNDFYLDKQLFDDKWRFAVPVEDECDYYPERYLKSGDLSKQIFQLWEPGRLATPLVKCDICGVIKTPWKMLSAGEHNLYFRPFRYQKKGYEGMEIEHLCEDCGKTVFIVDGLIAEFNEMERMIRVVDRSRLIARKKQLEEKNEFAI